MCDSKVSTKYALSLPGWHRLLSLCPLGQHEIDISFSRRRSCAGHADARLMFGSLPLGVPQFMPRYGWLTLPQGVEPPIAATCTQQLDFD